MLKVKFRAVNYSFRLYNRAAFARTKKKRSLRNENFKQTELRILKNRGKKAEDKTQNEKIEKHEKQRLATQRLKRGDDNELKRNLRLMLANTSGWPWKKKKEEQDWRMMHLF